MNQRASEQATQQGEIFQSSPERMAIEAVEAFASVGIESFLLLWVNAKNKKQGHKPDCGIAELRERAGEWLKKAEEHQVSLVVKPMPGPVPLFQLDDLDEAMMQAVKPLAFLILETSPGRFHGWFAVRGGDLPFWRRVKKKTSSDKSSAGASRISGTRNFKEKYAPFYPRVRTIHIAASLFVTPAAFEALGLVADIEPVKTAKTGGCGSVGSLRPKRFPDYQRCLDGASDASSHPGKDRSRADFLWCCQALEWRWPWADVAAELMTVSEKAREKGLEYVRRTVDAAAEAVKRTIGTTPPVS